MQIENETSTSRLLDDRLIASVPVTTSVTVTGSTISDITLITPVANEITRLEHFVICAYYDVIGSTTPYAMISVRQSTTTLWQARVELGNIGQAVVIWGHPILLVPNLAAYLRINQVNPGGSHFYDVSATVRRYLIA